MTAPMETRSFRHTPASLDWVARATPCRQRGTETPAQKGIPLLVKPPSTFTPVSAANIAYGRHRGGRAGRLVQGQGDYAPNRFPVFFPTTSSLTAPAGAARAGLTLCRAGRLPGPGGIDQVPGAGNGRSWRCLPWRHSVRSRASVIAKRPSVSNRERVVATYSSTVVGLVPPITSTRLLTPANTPSR